MPENIDAQDTGPDDALLRLIADTAPAMLAYFDARTLRCRFANINYARNFGLTPAEAVGKTVREIVGGHDYGIHETTADEHLDILSRIQKHTAYAGSRSFNGISKTTTEQLDLFETLNLPKPA